MATVAAPPSDNRLVLCDIDWRTYSRLLRAFDGHSGVRLTYDRGVLEIMTLTLEHESFSHLLGRMVIVLTEELGLPIKGGGSTTFRRRQRKKGLEPDECYWIASEPLMRGKKKIDLRQDPPPDLAIETDITHSSLDRLGIYAAIKVPEVWRYKENSLSFLLLGPDGAYAAAKQSRAFPSLEPTDLARFLALFGQMDENAMIRQFRAWVQSKSPTGGSSANQP